MIVFTNIYFFKNLFYYGPRKQKNKNKIKYYFLDFPFSFQTNKINYGNNIT